MQRRRQQSRVQTKIQTRVPSRQLNVRSMPTALPIVGIRENALPTALILLMRTRTVSVINTERTTTPARSRAARAIPVVAAAGTAEATFVNTYRLL